MSDSRTILAAAALAAAALTPSAALAAKADSTPELRGSPQMRIVDARHATLSFAADQLPRTRSGKPDAGITIANGGRVRAIKAGNRHGKARTYTATVTSPRAMRDRTKYTMTFRLGDSEPVTRSVKLYLPGARR